jgi:hypothetical protein
MVRLKMLKREAEQFQVAGEAAHSSRSRVTLFDGRTASLIRKRIYSIIDGGRGDLLNPRSPTAPQLFSLALPLLIQLFEGCNDAQEFASASGIPFICDSAIRIILSYLNSPDIASQRSGDVCSL